MLWSKTTVLAIFLLAVTACGFKPLYGTDKAGLSDPQAELATVRVSDIPDRLGQLVRNQLVDYLSPTGHASQKRYDLKVSLSLSSEGIALARDQSATRYNVQLIAHFKLTDLTNHKKVFEGQARSIAVYNVITSEYATLIARQDADRRAASDVADELRTRLSVFFSRRTKAS